MPAKKVDFLPLPFVGEPYRDSGYSVRLADLMRQRGDREAAMHLQRGDAAANMWLQAGSMVGNAVAGWQRNVEENRRFALEDAERRRRDEIAGLQFEAGKLELDRAKRRDRGESVARSLLPLARRGDGLTTYDRDLLAREFEAAGVADQLPSVFQALDEQEASHLKALEARRDAVAGDAFRVLSSGADEDTFSGLIEYWRANDALPARELEAMEKLGADPAQRERALLAAVQSSPRFAQQVAKLQEANAPKLQAFKPGDVVIDERNPQAGPLFSVPTEDKAPTVGSFEDFVIRSYGDNPTPAQIAEARKVYQQADDRPININTREPRPLTQTAEAGIINRLSGQWTQAAATSREMDRQIANMDAGLAAAKRGDIPQGTEAVLQTFLKMLDPNSVVREGEFYRLREGMPVDDRIRTFFQRINQGGFMPVSELEKYAKLAKEMNANRPDTLASTRKRIEATAARYGIPVELVIEEGAPARTDADGGGGGTVTMIAPDGRVLDVPASDVERLKGLGARVRN